MLPELKRRNVNHLFLENTFSETQRHLFHHYFTTGQMPGALLDFLNKLDLAEGIDNTKNTL